MDSSLAFDRPHFHVDLEPGRPLAHDAERPLHRDPGGAERAFLE